VKKLNDKQQEALRRFDGKLEGRLLTYLNSCVHCGLCGQSCHYYLTMPEERYLPAKKVDIVAGIYRRYHTLAGRLVPGLTGARDFDDATIREMTDLLFGACTMCGRCSSHCSIGIDIPFLVRTGRSMLADMGMVPKELQSTVDAALRSGNNMAIPRDEFVETLKWLEDDLRMEVRDPNAAIPLDQKGKHIVYTLNPREPKFFPLSISAMARIFYAAKEDWTLSTTSYDVTNYAYYSGDDVAAADITRHLYDEMTALEGDQIVLAECGHGYRSFRWEGPEWIEKPYPFKAVTCIELMADYIREGRIKLDRTLNKVPVTLHDPCNLVRLGGIIEEPRYILRHAVENFVEMTPNRLDNYCCGGGGGQLSMSDFNERRMQAGKLKADQIRRTGAGIVVAPCHNCIDQLMQLNQQYKLGVEIKTVGEVVADALVLE
jgi:Fe-S oxidoreductase